MLVSEFDYELPEELIAQRPAPERTASRLLHLDARSGEIEDLAFAGLPAQLGGGDTVVLNDTRVIKARLAGRKRTGGRIEVFVERALGANDAPAHARAAAAARRAPGEADPSCRGRHVSAGTQRAGRGPPHASRALYHPAGDHGRTPRPPRARCGHDFAARARNRRADRRIERRDRAIRLSGIPLPGRRPAAHQLPPAALHAADAGQRLRRHGPYFPR